MTGGRLEREDERLGIGNRLRPECDRHVEVTGDLGLGDQLAERNGVLVVLTSEYRLDVAGQDPIGGGVGVVESDLELVEQHLAELLDHRCEEERLAACLVPDDREEDRFHLK